MVVPRNELCKHMTRAFIVSSHGYGVRLHLTKIPNSPKIVLSLTSSFAIFQFLIPIPQLRLATKKATETKHQQILHCIPQSSSSSFSRGSSKCPPSVAAPPASLPSSTREISSVAVIREPPATGLNLGGKVEFVAESCGRPAVSLSRSDRSKSSRTLAPTSWRI